MRILHVCATYHPATVYGGPTTTVHQLLCAISKLGHDVSVLATDANGGERLTLRDANWGGVRARYCRAVPLNGYGVSVELWAALASAIPRAQVVHAHGTSLPSTTVAGWIARASGTPLVVSPHGSMMAWALGRKAMAKRAYRLLDAVPFRGAVFHATSEQEAADLRKLGVPRVYVAPNGVDPGLLRAPAGSDLRSLIDVPASARIAAWVGRFDPVKNLEPLVEATRGLGVELVLAGRNDNAYGDRIRAMTAGRRDVHLLGFADEALRRALLQQADVYVHPSFMENYGLAIAEALAAGCPVVASTGTPWAELERTGAGRWVEPEAATLRAAIEDLLGRERAELRRRAYALADRQSWEERACAHVAQYEALAAGGAR